MYTLDQIFELLTLQSFANFYNEGGEFDTWITDTLGGVSEEQAKNKLKELLDRIK